MEEVIKIFILLEIRYSIGNFGVVPYGKKLLGKVYYLPQKDGTNYWCNADSVEIPQEIKEGKYTEHVPFYFVDQ